ncbi:MAG: septal ring lytic transglycosylase RlpA family protein [Bacteroidales bacterium]
MKQLFATLSILLVFSFSSTAQMGYVQEGKASFYGDEFEGRTTASGEKYSHKKATCAHLTIPFGALVKITNLDNNATAIVRVNDRGPFVTDRIIDVSQSVAQRLGMLEKGIVNVKIEVIDSNGIGVQKNEPINQNNIDTLNTPEKVKQEKRDTAGTESIQTITYDDKRYSPTELFTVNINPAEQKGYTIQVGSYKELANILRIASDVQSTFKKEVKLQVASINGEKIYRLMVGSFNSRQEAEMFKEKVVKIYRDCFVVELRD